MEGPETIAMPLSGFVDEETSKRLKLVFASPRKAALDRAYDRDLRRAMQDGLRTEVLVDGVPQTVAQVMAAGAIADFLAHPNVFAFNAFQQATGEASVKVELADAVDGLSDIAGKGA